MMMVELKFLVKMNMMQNYEIDYTPPGYEVLDYKQVKLLKQKVSLKLSMQILLTDYDGSIADYEPRVLDDVDEILTSDLQRWKLMQTGKNDKDIPIKSGEGRVIENEVRADQAADYARERLRWTRRFCQRWFSNNV